MGINEAMNYVLFNNPVSSNMWSALSYGARVAGIKPKQVPPVVAPQVTQVTQQVLPPAWKILGSNRYIMRIAGLSGATAIILGAYGSHHRFNITDEAGRDPKQVFDMTNRYHFMHTLALMAAPFARKPLLTTALLTSGMSIFCGTCYYISVTNDRTVAKYTPVGGFLLIFAWLSFVL